MSFRLSRRVLLAAFSVATASPIQLVGQTVEADTGRSVVFPAAREFTLVSQINGRSYRLVVALPLSYREGRAGDTTRYPVLYVLDGGVDLPMYAGMYRHTNQGEYGNLILVGIGYTRGAAGGAPAGAVPYRQIDYTPPPFPYSDSAQARLRREWPESGGAPAFLRALREEIIPFVERRYRMTDDRGIRGHSFGGLFATYALLEDPDLFKRYLITSPSLWWDDGSMFAREAAFARRNPRLAKRIYLSSGTKETPRLISDMWRLASVVCEGLNSKTRYQGVDVVASINTDEYHVSSVHFARALAAMYPGGEPGGSGLYAPAVRICGADSR